MFSKRSDLFSELAASFMTPPRPQQPVDLDKELMEAMKLQIPDNEPQYVKDLILGIAKEMFKQNHEQNFPSGPELKKELKNTMVAAEAVALHIEMLELQREAKELIQKCLRNEDPETNKYKLELNLKKQHKIEPDPVRKKALAEMCRPNFVEKIIEKCENNPSLLSKPKNKNDKKSDEPTNKLDTPAPAAGKDPADELMSQLLNTPNPHMTTGQSIVVTRVVENYNGIVEQNTQLKSNALFEDTERDFNGEEAKKEANEAQEKKGHFSPFKDPTKITYTPPGSTE